MQYAARDESFNESIGANGVQLSLDKGLLLLGPVGTRKTITMRILRQTLYEMKSALHFSATDMGTMCAKYQESGDVLLLSYKHLFVDEFGMPERESVKSYGNSVIMGDELIRARYNLFQQMPSYLTHVTTNMKLSEMEKYYQPRTVDRIHEMFNIIPCKGPSYRKMAKPLPKVVTHEEEKPDLLQVRKQFVDTVKRQFKAYKETGNLAVLFPRYLWNELKQAGYMNLTPEQVADIKEEAKTALIKEKANKKMTVGNMQDVRELTAAMTRIESGNSTEQDKEELRTKGCEISIKKLYDSIDDLIIE